MPTPAEPQFLNVDLDLKSKHDLAPLLEAFGKKVVPLHNGKERRTHFATLELTYFRLYDPEKCLRRFLDLIERLPPDARRRWDAATSRSFDIGIRAALPNGRQYAARITPRR